MAKVHSCSTCIACDQSASTHRRDWEHEIISLIDDDVQSVPQQFGLVGIHHDLQSKSIMPPSAGL